VLAAVNTVTRSEQTSTKHKRKQSISSLLGYFSTDIDAQLGARGIEIKRPIHTF